MPDEKCSKISDESATALALTVKLTASIQEEATEGGTIGRPWTLLHQMASRQVLPVARTPSYSGHGASSGEVGGSG